VTRKKKGKERAKGGSTMKLLRFCDNNERRGVNDRLSVDSSVRKSTLRAVICQVSPVVGRLVVFPDCTVASSASSGGLARLGLTGVGNCWKFPAGVVMVARCFLKSKD
jgi:hypothetical protein